MKNTNLQYIKQTTSIECRFHFTLLFFISFFTLFGQQTNLSCNTVTPWIDDALFTVTVNNSSTGLACWDEEALCLLPGNHGTVNVINTNLTDFARGEITGIGSLTLRVTDSSNDYNEGNFAGFRIDRGIIEVGVFNAITISTYLNGTLQESFTAGQLLAIGVDLINDQFDLGFVTSTSFDAIEITVTEGLGLGFFDVYHAIMVDYCPGPDLVCNIQTPANLPLFPMTIDYENTGASGVGVGSVMDAEDAIRQSTSDYASLTNIVNIAGSTFITIKDQLSEYPSGTFAGFDIENLNIAGVELLNNLNITTYLDEDEQESISGTDLILGAPLLSTDGRHIVGFVTTQPFNSVRFTITQPLNVGLGTTRVYSAIFREFCEGQPFPCNTVSALVLPEYPVFIDDEYTGIMGGVCVGCTVNNSDRVIDSDLDNFAAVTIVSGVLNIGSIAVKNQLTDYSAGTFAGFHVENPNLVDLNVLEGISITTLLDGVIQESHTNLGALITIGSEILVNTGEHIIGFVSTESFDEVIISLSNTAEFNIGTTLVYNVVIEPFCQPEINCDSTYYLTNPKFPSYIDPFLTGVDGIGCVGCEVEGEQNLLTADTSDYAIITIPFGVAGSSSIAVADALFTYPQGTFAGFVIEDPAFNVEAELFETITISTYNNGVIQESKSGSDLIDLGVIILFISADEGRYNIGFYATLPFDEIRISTGSLATAINLVRVYSAFVDTRESNGGPLLCALLPVQWLSFTAKKEGISSVMLTWVTGNEENNSLYEVERSEYDTGFESIARIEPHSSTDEVHLYTFLDEHPANGINYYRIRQTDRDGKVSYSPTRNFAFTSEWRRSFTTWPNPARGSLFIERARNEDFPGEIRLIDGIGNLILSESLEEEDYYMHLDIRDLEPGLYYLIIESSHSRQIEKIVIVK